MKNLTICLFEPEIAQNTGAIARLCACFDVRLSIIEPAAFIFDNDKRFRRAGMDYIEKVDLVLHTSFDEFRKFHVGRIVLFDVKATKRYFDLQFRESDCIMFGKESSGVPEEIFRTCDENVVIPMDKENGARSLNISMCAAIALSEAVRQFWTAGVSK
jgi:tRNA (cytidine/uridine-2'-O-)-methyltransferase